MRSEKDIKTILPLHFQKVVDIYSSCYPYKKADALLAQLRLGNVGGFIADDGFILFSVVADEAEIIDLCVRDEARGKGLGFRLMDEALRSLGASGVRNIYLEFADGNIAASKLYNKVGFVVTGRRNNYYKSVDGSSLNAITMAFRVVDDL